MPDLIALAAMRYRNRSLRPGDRFDALTDRAALMLTRVRLARIAEPEPEPEPPAEKPERPEPKRKTVPYQRRDMRAED